MPAAPHSSHTIYFNFIEPGLPQRIIENYFNWFKAESLTQLRSCYPKNSAERS